jgi:hypothetical protein
MTTMQTEKETPMKTLAELNAEPREHVWGDTYRVRMLKKVGRAGRRGTGTKVHLLRTELILEELVAHKPGTYRVGQYFGVGAICSHNGQHTGQVFEHLDTDAITCRKCLDWLGVTPAPAQEAK